MNINLTLIGQLIAFTIFVLFCMKYVWPPVSEALAERQKKIAEGLDAADKAARDLETAKAKIEVELGSARAQATDLLEQANKRSSQIVNEAQGKAREEAEKIMASAQAQMAQEVAQAREILRADVAKLAISGAERVLNASVDAAAHKKLLTELAEEL
ncbi:F0F1 ATP synthase subunit B [Litorivicinus sp.]|nr:F0F1 ATP synthase subunit B [Litorivicinus sp.]MDC1319370.1 F0F1 ATP synthase subunit B [Litorivicinus sp.]